MSAFASMSNFGRLFARPVSLAFVGCAALALAGCGPTGEPRFDNSMAAPTTPVQTQPLNGSPAVGETLGAGPVRIGVIVRVSSAG